ncbi:hypothetical protein BDK51DRAFT_43254 [Blyttiomyces helicus]|uniref:Uncharacterized protein n=1 Tax=Blyttiomyces helicus TaxID=388810 RepID=A0A4P9W6R4_9FUNG|nr:hypothetical protein BDK51DRAFT_43254 [Blyttiomyces helicus]|eukprot:RKO88024.1 hypothetical protein BDK51DRAFT_43254 [Blyttiomyces helicus]
MIGTTSVMTGKDLQTLYEENSPVCSWKPGSLTDLFKVEKQRLKNWESPQKDSATTPDVTVRQDDGNSDFTNELGPILAPNPEVATKRSSPEPDPEKEATHLHPAATKKVKIIVRNHEINAIGMSSGQAARAQSTCTSLVAPPSEVQMLEVIAPPKQRSQLTLCAHNDEAQGNLPGIRRRLYTLHGSSTEMTIMLESKTASTKDCLEPSIAKSAVTNASSPDQGYGHKDEVDAKNPQQNVGTNTASGAAITAINQDLCMLARIPIDPKSV